MLLPYTSQPGTAGKRNIRCFCFIFLNTTVNLLIRRKKNQNYLLLPLKITPGCCIAKQHLNYITNKTRCSCHPRNVRALILLPFGNAIRRSILNRLLRYYLTIDARSCAEQMSIGLERF